MTDEKPFSISATLTPTEVRALMAEYKRRYGPKFEKGDLVVLKSGSTQMTVLDGTMKAIECGYTRTFAWRGQNTACKVAMPLSIIQQ